MPKLLSSMHPLSQLPLLSVLVLTLRRSLPNFPCPAASPLPPPPFSPIFRPVRPFLVLFRHALSASGHHPRPSVSRLPSCDTPNLYALIPVHTDSGYLRERVYFWQRLPCIIPPQSLFPSIPVPFTRDRSFAPYNCGLRVTRFIFEVSRPRLRGRVYLFRMTWRRDIYRTALIYTRWEF